MGRTLIALFDGTGLDAASSGQFFPTNIYQLNLLVAQQRIVRTRSNSQVTFYFPGIGVERGSGSFASLWAERLFGVGIFGSVCRAYVNLCSNYRNGDEICIFGYSRGAISSRVLSRIIADFGLLKSRSLMMTEELMANFESAITNPERYQNIAANFRNGFAKEICEGVRIKYLGLLDCVSGPKDKEIGARFFEEIDGTLSEGVENFLHLLSMHDVRGEFVLRRISIPDGKGKEVWMPGTHSDVGGGMPANLLVNIALLTIAHDAMVRAKIAFEEENLANLKMAVKVDLRNEDYVINKEGTESFLKRDRAAYFRSGEPEYLHAIHDRMIGHAVKWKDEGSVSYEHRMGQMPIDDLSAKVMQEFKRER